MSGLGSYSRSQVTLGDRFIESMISKGALIANDRKDIDAKTGWLMISQEYGLYNLCLYQRIKKLAYFRELSQIYSLTTPWILPDSRSRCLELGGSQRPQSQLPRGRESP